MLQDADALDALVRETVAGDGDAQAALLVRITPLLQTYARGHGALRARGLHKPEHDDVQEVVSRCLERLLQRERRNLARYLAQREADAERAQSFESWLYGAVELTVREHLRQRYGRTRAAQDGSARPHRRLLESQAARIDDERDLAPLGRALGLTTQLALREILEFVDGALSPEEARVLRLHFVEDRGPVEIAQLLDFPDEGVARRMIRSLTARLRYRFAER